MGTVSLQTNLPKWARPLRERAQKALEQGQSGQADSNLHLLPTDSEQTTLIIGESRDSFIQARRLDEKEGTDLALGQPGKVKLEDGTDISFSGTSLQGSVTSTDQDFYRNLSYDGPVVRYETFHRDGRIEAGRLNMAAPEKSIRLSTRSADEARVPIAKSKYFGATYSSVDFLQSIPPGSKAEVFRDVFLTGDKSMTDVRRSFLSDFSQAAEDCGLTPEDVASLKTLLQEPHARTPRMFHDSVVKLAKDNPENLKLKDLKVQSGLWQAVEDFPKLQADGITRTTQYIVSPQLLELKAAAQGWDFDPQTNLPIADTIVVGGGPGGLASTYHLSERGTRTVLFEGGQVGQGFSDAGAKSVHQLRTNGLASNLLYTANSNSFGIDVSMNRHLAENRKKCKEAREDWYDASNEKLHGYSRAGVNDLAGVANRAELFEHMSHVAHGLALNYADTFVSENSPVTSIEKLERPDGHLFKVTTDRGHQVLTKSLVMATGFVGGDGEHARNLSIFQGLEDQAQSGVTVLESDNDLFKDNDDIDKDLLVFSERLVGRPEIRQKIKQLPAGSRIAVVGGGESATKGALEALYLNDDIVLDLYTSGALEPYQTQIPLSVINPAVSESAIRNKDVARKTLDELKEFKTPVTPGTLRELYEMEAAGRVRIHEFGKRFDERSVSVEPDTQDGKTSLQISLKDPEVAENLRAQRSRWIELGLYGQNPPAEPADVLPKADMVMVAAGYDKRSLRAGPLIQQLIDQDLVELNKGEIVYGNDGLTSVKDNRVAFNTAGAAAMASDTAIAGRAVRGYRLAETFAQRLPEREKPTDGVAKGLPFGSLNTQDREEHFNWDKARVLDFIDSGGISSDDLKRRYDELKDIQDPQELASAKLRLDADIRYPAANSSLAALMIRAHEAPETLSPAEKLLWQKAQDQTERLRDQVAS